MRTSRRAALALASAAALRVAMPGPAYAQADFEGQTITITVPYREGGGTDTWARFLAGRMPEYLPGSPKVVVRNQPAGGGIGGANDFARRAADDGTAMLATAGGLQLPYLLGDGRVQYDYADWFPLLATPFGGVVYVRAEDAPEDPADLLEREGMRFPSIGANSSDLVPLIAFSLMGLDTNVAFGMEGRSPARLAIMRGESDLDYQTSSAYIENVQPLVDEGTMTPLFAWGVIDDAGEVQRDPTFPDLPSFPEYHEMVTGEPPSGPGWDAWKAVYAAGFAFQKFLVVPMAVPEEVRTTLRDELGAMARDPAFQEAAREALGEYPQIHGGALDSAMESATTMSGDSREWVTQWLLDTYDFEL